MLIEDFHDPVVLSDDISSEYCDVCEKKSESKLDLVDLKEEIKILIDAINILCLIAEWIQGSSLAWTEP